MRQIATNAGIDGSVVLENVKKADKVGYGFDAYNETYVDMISAGIVDPTKVTRSALENAASIAATLLTTESRLPPIWAACTEPERKKARNRFGSGPFCRAVACRRG